MDNQRTIQERVVDACAFPRRQPSSGRAARHFLGLASLLALVACGQIEDGTVYCDADETMGNEDDVDEASILHAKSLGVTDDQARVVLRTLPKDARGLPIYESRPGAKVALFLDFDGGTYEGSNRETYRGASLDADLSHFNGDEQVAIVRAALEVAKSYEGFDVNVTTSDAARLRASKWSWILITNDESTSGWARIGSVGRSSFAKAVAGVDAVLAPPSSQRGYLLTHELGHTFGLHHTGLWTNGSFREWSQIKSSRTGDWLGGRSSYFTSYTWMTLQTEASTAFQDPKKVIAGVAGFAAGGTTDQCPNDPNKTQPGQCGCGVAEGTCGSGTKTLTLVVGDAFVDSASPGSNHGTSTTLELDSSPSTQRVLMKPRGLDSVPAGARITSAQLVLEVSDAGNHVSVRKLMGAFSESSVTYSNAPSASGEFATMNGSLGTKTIDVTTLMQAWVNGEAPHGIGLYPTGVDGVDIYSNEHATATNRPYFRVTYRVGG